MGLKVNNASFKTTFEYVPLAQRGEKKPFTIIFEALKMDKLAKLKDNAMRVDENGNYTVSLNTLNYEVLKSGIVGWKNIEDAKGAVKFKSDKQGASDESLTLIPIDIRNEIATIIVEVSNDLPNAEEYLAEIDRLFAESAKED